MGWYYFFSTMEAKAFNLLTCGNPESLRARVASLGFVSRDPRAAPARFPRADTSLVYPRERARSQTVTHNLSFGYFCAESAERSSTWFAFSERSRKCIVARARPHFLRRRVRVSKAFTAALNHRPVPSDNVSTSRPLRMPQFPGTPKRPIADTFSPLHSATQS